MKKYLLGLFAIALAIGFSAFTADHSKKGLTTFKFSGTSSAQYTNSSFWTITTSQTGCSGGSLNCSVTPNDVAINTTSELVAEIAADDFNDIVINSTKP